MDKIQENKAVSTWRYSCEYGTYWLCNLYKCRTSIFDSLSAELKIP